MWNSVLAPHNRVGYLLWRCWLGNCRMILRLIWDRVSWRLAVSPPLKRCLNDCWIQPQTQPSDFSVHRYYRPLRRSERASNTRLSSYVPFPICMARSTATTGSYSAILWVKYTQMSNMLPSLHLYMRGRAIRLSFETENDIYFKFTINKFTIHKWLIPIITFVLNDAE